MTPISEDEFRQMRDRTDRARGVSISSTSNEALKMDKAPKRTANAAESERDLHDEFERYLIERGYLYVHARMDVPSTIAVGHPDFTVFMPQARACFIEFKARGTKTTTAQMAKISHARKLGFVAEIADNIPDALSILAKASV